MDVGRQHFSCAARRPIGRVMGDPEEVTRIEPEPGWFCRVDQLGNVVRERQREPGDEPEGQELLVPGEPGSVLSLAWNGQVWIVLRVRAR